MVLAGKNVLVTGGCGFFGGHLVKRLIEAGSNVFVTDFVTPPQSYYLQQQLNKKVVFERCNLSNFEEINYFITKNSINFVFHVAAAATVESALYNPLATITFNVLGTTNILESCRQFGKIEGVFFTSTDKAYGKLPRVDETKPLSGDHPYEVSKASADLITRAYYKTYDLPVVVSRFGNVYGEGDLNFDRIIPGIMKSILNGKKLSIRSNGRYVRDYVYVKDVVDASIMLAKNIEKVKGEAFNISSYENLSVLDLIIKIEKILNLKIRYKILSTAKNEIPIQSVNFNKIKKTLGWKPRENLRTSIPAVFDWYKSYFEGVE